MTPDKETAKNGVDRPNYYEIAIRGRSAKEADDAIRLAAEASFEIQGTYQVRQDLWQPGTAGHPIRLIWDYWGRDHKLLWGTFVLRTFRGVFLVNPGPGLEDLQVADDCDHHGEDVPEPNGGRRQPRPILGGKVFPLVWRGTSTAKPDTLFNSQLTVGTINFGNGTIWGTFEAMRGFDFPNGRCDFSATRHNGQANFPAWRLQDVIHEWNKLENPPEQEVPRGQSDPPNKDGMKDGNNNYQSKATQSRAAEPVNLTSDFIMSLLKSPVIPRPQHISEQTNLLRAITGIFDLSTVPEGGLASQSQGMTIRFHVDEAQNRVWGQFDVGNVDGYLLLSLPTGDKLVYDAPIEFELRGRESETGKSLIGTFAVIFFKHRGNVLFAGSFFGTDAVMDFQGNWKPMPEGTSGRGTAYYLRGWDDYRPGVDSDLR